MHKSTAEFLKALCYLYAILCYLYTTLCYGLYFAGIGLLNPVTYYLVLFKAYDLLPAQVAQSINYAWPIVLLILLSLFAHQPISPKKYIGMFASLGGVALITVGSAQEGISVSVSGLLLAGLSATLWATFWHFFYRSRPSYASRCTIRYVYRMF